MMRLGLPPHIHVAVSGAHVIFLDTQQDRYRAARLSPSLRAILDGDAAADDENPDCKRLVRDRLLTELGPQSRPFRSTEVSIPGRSILETNRPRGTLSMPTAVRVGCSLRLTHRRLRRTSLESTLRTLSLWKERCSAETSPDRLCALSLRFADHRALLPPRRICLRDSLALLHFMRRAGCTADLVFGVQANPFYAHCWVQAGPWILNDSAYFPRTLAPILVV